MGVGSHTVPWTGGPSGEAGPVLSSQTPGALQSPEVPAEQLHLFPCQHLAKTVPAPIPMVQLAGILPSVPDLRERQPIQAPLTKMAHLPEDLNKLLQRNTDGQ